MRGVMHSFPARLRAAVHNQALEKIILPPSIHWSLFYISANYLLHSETCMSLESVKVLQSNFGEGELKELLY